MDVGVNGEYKNNLTLERDADITSELVTFPAKRKPPTKEKMRNRAWNCVSNVSKSWKNFRTTWKENHAWPVFYSTLVANILSLNFGMTLGYAAPAIPDLMTDDEVTSINDTSIIFSAMVPFGAMVSGPMISFFLELLGRHMTLMLCAAPYTIGWLLIMLTRSTNGRAFLPILYIGRFFTGVGVGWTNGSVPCYVAELSPSPLRGLFVGIFGISVASGILLIQLCGIIPGATYYWLPVVPLTTLTVFAFLMALVTKETPRWLQKTRRIKGAKLVLQWLRGEEYDVDKEQKEIAEQIAQQKKQNMLQKFKKRSTLYPLFLGCCLTAFQQLSGINAITFYSQVIFSGVQGISDNADIVSTFCVGATQVIGTIFLLSFVDKFGRRKMLLVNGMFMCLSAASMGIYYIFNSKPYCDPDNEEDNDCVTGLNPVAIISLMVYTCAFAAAWGGLPYLVGAELLPLHIRGAGLGIKTLVGWFAATIVLLSFEPYQEAVNPWGAFFTFSFIMFCAVVFVYKFIPETKGKTLEEIQQHFIKSKRNEVHVNGVDSKPACSLRNFHNTEPSHKASFTSANDMSPLRETAL